MPAMKKIAILSSIFLILGIFLFISKDVVFAGYGEAGVAPSCGNPAPEKPWLYSAETAGSGAVDLLWTETNRAGSWTVAYGVQSGVYVYGVDRFGNADSRTIRISGLPGGRYYFVIRGNNGCMPGPFSDEKVVTVGRGAAVITPVTYVPGASPTPTPRPTATPGTRYVPPTGEEEEELPPLYSPVPSPSPTPGVGIIGRIVNFFLGLFGLR